MRKFDINNYNGNFGNVRVRLGEQPFDTVSGIRENISQPTEITSTDVLNENQPTPKYRNGEDEYWNRIPNPLRNYNSYNYIITLACLTPEEYNDPTSYRKNGFSNIILRSGGGEYDKRITVAQEDKQFFDPSKPGTMMGISGYSEHAEYYIEDVEIDGVIAPNQNTRLTLGTNVRFKVIEPYSMGKFIEALAIAATESKFSDYTHAPYCLRFDFVGWWPMQGTFRDVRNDVIKSSYIPMQITKLDFQATEQGSVYEAEAVVYNDSSFFDTVNKTKTPIDVCGGTVSEVLNEVTLALNSLKEDQTNEKRIPGYDKYVIFFPENLDSANKILNEEADQPPIQEQIDGLYQTNQNNQNANKNVKVNQNNKQSKADKLLLSALYSGETNRIGSSSVIKDPQQTGNSCFVTIETNSTDAKPRAMAMRDPNKRKFQFSQYETITNIIESVIKKSKYAEEFAFEKSQDGFKDFYRILSKVIIDDSQEIDAKVGRYPKVYVYAIVPYKTNESRNLPPNQNPRSIDVIRTRARKEYNYYYTGKNEDVLDFKINFNNAYFNIVYNDLARSPATPGSNSVGNSRKETGKPEDRGFGKNFDETNPPVESQDPQSRESGAKYSSESGHKERMAEMVHERIVNSNVDMITAEIDIWGDPYYIPSNVGNYNPPSVSYGLTVDDTMDYADKEVYIIVNFITPFDYQTSGSLMDFPEQYTRFSGIYQVWGVTCIFSGGEFKQNLKLIRINKQNSEETAANDPTQVKETGGVVKELLGGNAGIGAALPGNRGDGFRGSNPDEKYPDNPPPSILNPPPDNSFPDNPPPSVPTPPTRPPVRSDNAIIPR